MPYITTEAEVDLDVDEFWDMCTKREKQELVKIIVDDGYATTLKESESLSINDEQWLIVCEKLARNRLSLSLEQEELIKKISENLF